MTDHLYLLKEEAAFSGGLFEDIIWNDGCLSLSPCDSGFASQGTYTTPQIKAPLFSALIGSWNACVPQNCTLAFSARIFCGEEWSSWMHWGEWSPFSQRAGCPGQSDNFARLDSDMILAQTASGASAFQLRIVLRGDGNETPSVYLMAASLKMLRSQPERGNPLYQRAVPVPAYSLCLRDVRIGMCAATPMVCTMLMNRWGEDVLPEETAYACYDYGAENFCNRAFASALASTYGFESYTVFTDVAGLKREVKNGFGCGVRVRAEHIGLDCECSDCAIVVRGFETDEDGTEHVLINNPFASTDAEVKQRYLLDDLLSDWDGCAFLLHRRRGNQKPCGPQRTAGELRRTEIPGEYAFHFKGTRYSLPTDLCDKNHRCTGTVCYTIKDDYAYATTAHNRFYYSAVSALGNVLLDTAQMPAGTRLTVYVIIEFGKMAVASLTL